MLPRVMPPRDTGLFLNVDSSRARDLSVRAAHTLLVVSIRVSIDGRVCQWVGVGGPGGGARGKRKEYVVTGMREKVYP